GPIGSEENNEHGRYVTNDMWGESITLEYVQPADVIGEPHLHIMGAGYFYRYVYPPAELAEAQRGSGNCHVEVNCPEGEDWQFQRDAVVRLRITDDGEIGLCSGAMVNTTARDCRQYLLTALHCAPNLSTSDFGFLQVRFNYERPESATPFSECSNGSFSSSRNRTGVVHLADSDDYSSFQGFQGSDFMLLEVEDEIPSDWRPYYAGWEAANLGSPEGVGIHHPAGDLKKISNYDEPTTSIFLGAPGSHWEVTWIDTESGHGVTEGGSSGSPLFNEDRKIIGTLSAGLAACQNSGQFGPDEPDWYGKMSYHWTNNPNSADQKLRVWLDPDDLGWTTLWGSYVNEGGDCDPFLSIPENTLDLDVFQISPNPSSGQLNIKITDEVLNGTIEVFDLQGKIIFSEQITSPVNTIDFSHLTAGIYYVRVANVQGQARTKKWSKI
ncbi:MAG: T9SS type A sorting domain-containing protein, partial [Flavobacteriales bacterium]